MPLCFTEPIYPYWTTTDTFAEPCLFYTVTNKCKLFRPVPGWWRDGWGQGQLSVFHFVHPVRKHIPCHSILTLHCPCHHLPSSARVPFRFRAGRFPSCPHGIRLQGFAFPFHFKGFYLLLLFFHGCFTLVSVPARPVRVHYPGKGKCPSSVP